MRWIVTMTLLVGCGAQVQRNAADRPWQVIPHGFTGLQVVQGQDILWEMDSEVVGPEGAAPRMRELPRVVASGKRVYAETLRSWIAARGKKEPDGMPPVDFHYEAVAPASDRIELRYRCAAQAEVKLTGVSLVTPYGDWLGEGKIRLQLADGAAREFVLPLSGRDTMGLSATSVAIVSATGQEVAFQFDEPLAVDVQRQQMRIWPVSGGLKADQTVERRITVPESPRHRRASREKKVERMGKGCSACNASQVLQSYRHVGQFVGIA